MQESIEMHNLVWIALKPCFSSVTCSVVSIKVVVTSGELGLEVAECYYSYCFAGVFYCGPATVGKQLEALSWTYTQKSSAKFSFHKENFWVHMTRDMTLEEFIWECIEPKLLVLNLPRQLVALNSPSSFSRQSFKIEKPYQRVKKQLKRGWQPGQALY